MTLFWILCFTFLASVGSLLIAGMLLLFRGATQKKIIFALIAYATGGLLTTALISLIPEAVEYFVAHGKTGGVERTLGTVLVGIFIFFILEKLFMIHHCHNTSCDLHKKSTGSMVLIGDGLHNFLDGVLIAAGFIVSFPVGVAVSGSIIIHEIAHEIADFGILLHSGYSKHKALVYNLLSSLTAFLGAMLGYFFLQEANEYVPYVMALSAASFIYVALVDLAPELHKKFEFVNCMEQFVLMFLGSGTVLLLLYGLGH